MVTLKQIKDYYFWKYNLDNYQLKRAYLGILFFSATFLGGKLIWKQEFQHKES